MQKSLTRRDLLKFAGGSALGLLFTPLPWKLLDDSAIWTQNWALTPKLSHGPITTKFSSCTLCPAGCAVKAHCVDGLPFRLTGVHHHPMSNGAVCARGLAGHHLAYHPLRMTIPHKFSGRSAESRLIPYTLNNSIKEISAAIDSAQGSVVILDQSPNRTSSIIFKQFTEKLQNGIYATLSSDEESTLLALQEMFDEKNISLGYDFEKTEMIVSFGAPLLDGFGTPGLMTKLYNERKTSRKKFIQIESCQSRTALQADQWIPIKPGVEGIIALNIAFVLLNEIKLHNQNSNGAKDISEYKKNLKNFIPERTEHATGIQPGVIRKLALDLASARSSIILGGADPGGGSFGKETEKAIAGLNLILGNVGKSGAITERKNENVQAEPWPKIPDHSISVLIMDSYETGYAVPWQLIEQKLIPDNNIVVTLLPYLNEISAHTDYIIPTTTYYESVRDIPTPAGSPVNTFAISQPLLPKPDGTIEETEFISQVASVLHMDFTIASAEERIKEKVNSIYSTKRGKLFSFSDGQSKPLIDISTANDFYSQLLDGATWIDEKASKNLVKKFSLKADIIAQPSSQDRLLLIPFGWRGAVSSSSLSPIMSKLFQESELRENANTVLMNPQTIADAKLNETQNAILETKSGSMPVKIKSSNTVPLNVIYIPVGPLPNGSPSKAYLNNLNALSMCEVKSDGTWRITNAAIRNQTV